MRTKKVLVHLKRYLLMLLGTFITAVGLELFLIPNNIIDGGVVGISIILTHLTHIPLGVYIFSLNLPFLFFGYKEIGKTFVLSSLFAIGCLSMWVSILHLTGPFTQNVLLASVFGGIIVGIGVGLVIRYGGSLDGTEIIAIVINERTLFSVGQIVMFFNIFILSSAGLVFGWENAMYSIIAYFIAFKLIDITIAGLDETKAAFIVTEKADEMAEVISARLGRGVTIMNGVGGYSKEEKKILYSVITRIEMSKLNSIIDEIDETAFVTISDVADVRGGTLKKKGIH